MCCHSTTKCSSWKKVSTHFKRGKSFIISFWSSHEVLERFCINNNLPLLDYKSPFEIHYHTKPSYSHLCVFGSLCFASTLNHTWHKFDPHACQCIFWGYPYSVKGYKLLDLNTSQMYVSNDVAFHEHIFPLRHSPPTQDISPITPISQPSQSFQNIFIYQPSNIPMPHSFPISDLKPISKDKNLDSHAILRRSTKTRQASAFLGDFHYQ